MFCCLIYQLRDVNRLARLRNKYFAALLAPKLAVQ